MRLIFIDHENVGFNTLDEINPTGLDKVFVFSHAEKANEICSQRNFKLCNDYPVGSNQADFYIVSYLSRALALTPSFDNVTFILSSNDVALSQAFQFQCGIYGVTSKIITAKPKPKFKITEKDIERVVSAFDTPDTMANIQSRVGLAQSEFAKVTHSLIAMGAIRRLSKKSKKWLSNSDHCGQIGVLT